MRTTITRYIKNNRVLFFMIKPIIHLNRYIFREYFRNKKFLKNGEFVLLEAKRALESANVLFWLDFGTLLGVYRDGAFLTNDLDIDLGIFLDDYSVEIENVMKKHGFKLIKEYHIDNKKYGLEQTYILKGVTIDLFYYTVKNDIMYSHLFHHFPKLTYAESIEIKGGLLPIEQYLPISSFDKISFLNHNFTVPIPTDKYLSYHYGDEYKTSKPWSYYDLENDNKNAKFLYNKIGVVSQFKNK